MSIEIDGVYMDRSLNDFTRSCFVYLEAEQAKLAPDTHLVALLCDAIRLTRELALLSEQGIEEARQNVARYRYVKSCAHGVSLVGMDGRKHWYVSSYDFRYATRTFDEAIDRGRHDVSRRIRCLHCGSLEAEHGFHGRCETIEWRGTGATYTVRGDEEQGPSL